MPRHTLTALIAGLLILAAPQARAIPFCEEFPEAPICNPDPEDPCELDPASCEPDPCELDPASCEPDPCELDPASCEPDPCELDPASCEPDPCELDPASCEPEALDQWADLAGTGVVKADGSRERAEASMDLYFGTESFMLVPESCVFLTGALLPKGTKGNKFQLFLDDASRSTYASFVAERAAGLRRLAPAHVLGESSKLILKLRHDGSAVLRIKSQVLLFGVDEVVFKANLSGPVLQTVEATARSRGQALCP
jgi:hypothetical protein